MKPQMSKKDLDDVIEAFYKVYENIEELKCPTLGIIYKDNK